MRATRIILTLLRQHALGCICLKLLTIKRSLHLNKMKKKYKSRRWWVRPILYNRQKEGLYHLYKDKNAEHGFMFSDLYRVKSVFQMIANAIRPFIIKRHISCSDVISVEECLAV